MCKIIPFIELMKEVYFIFDIHLPNPEVSSKYLKKINAVLLSRSLTSSHQEKDITLLSIIIYKALHKRRLFEYATLIHENKQRLFSLSH